MPLRPTQLIGNWRAKRLTGILVGVFTLLICSIFTASPSMAVTVTTIYHSCEGIGTPDSYGNSAVICTDLLAYEYSNNTWQVASRTEAICEDINSDIVQCANATVLNESVYQNDSGTYFSGYEYGACGHSNGNCPDGRFYVTNTTLLPTSGPVSCIANTWAVTNKTDDFGQVTSIQLPTSGKTIDLPADFATFHASLC